MKRNMDENCKKVVHLFGGKLNFTANDLSTFSIFYEYFYENF